MKAYIDKNKISVDGTTEIFFKVKIYSKYFKVMSGIKINPGAWDQQGQQILKGRKQYNVDDLNKLLEKKRKIVHQKTVNHAAIDEIREAMKLKKETRKSRTFTDDFYTFYDHVHAQKMQLMSKDYSRKYGMIKKHLEKFNPDLSITELNNIFFNEYLTYLYDLKLKPSTINEHFKIIKVVLKEAGNYGFKVPIDFKTWKIKINKQKMIWLTWDEVSDLDKLVHENETYNRIKDCFVFRCFTGIRFSDMALINKSCINKNEDYHYLSFTKVKQRDAHQIALTDRAYAILEKYGYSLPMYAMQTENIYIKTICAAAKINKKIQVVSYEGKERKVNHIPKWKLISSHTARRSFARHWAEQGGSIDRLSQYLGHSSTSITLKYIDWQDEEVASEMMRIFN